MITVLGLSILAILSSKRKPYAAVGWFWFLAYLLPVIGLVQLGAHSIADRYTYFALIGIAISFTWVAADLAVAWQLPANIPPASSILLLMVLAVVARLQLGYWHDSQTLFEHAVAASKNNIVANNNLGTLFLRQGNWTKAEEHYAAALRAGPSLLEAHVNWAVILAHQGRPEEALHEIKSDPSYATSPLAHFTLGNLLAQSRSNSAAIEEYSAALKLKPDCFEAHNALGGLLAQQRDFNAAVAQFQAALLSSPDNTDAHFNLAHVLNEIGRFTDAASHFSQVLQRNPSDWVAPEGFGYHFGS
jgi:tetratricopeptide (TPR) repeat protein